MKKKLKAQIVFLTGNNLKGYILLSAIFAAGMVSALIFGSNVPQEEIKLYITEFVSNAANSGIDRIKTFNFSMANYIQFAFAMFLLSLTVVGAPAVLIYVLFNGFSFGAVVSCLFKAFGAKAFLIVFCAVLPHVIVSAPCCLAYSLHCAKKARGLFTGNISLKKSVIAPLGFGLLYLCAVSIAALTQAYIEPFLIKLISLQFV